MRPWPHQLRASGLAWAAMILVSLLALRCPAQTAPAGNAHPPTEVLSEGTTKLPNPFGEPVRGAAISVEQKRALVAGLDLEPLRKLAVQHDGRVKILDTLARETVLRITGHKTYQDIVTSPDGGEARLSYDPLFTFLDLLIDPSYYVQKPLVHVEYLPLRKEFLEATFPDRPDSPKSVDAERERWLRWTRLSPVMIVSQGDVLRAKYESKGMDGVPYLQALSQANQSLEIFEFGAANLLLVAPESMDLEYRHLSTLPDDHPARRAAAKLGEAWRARDAAGVNSAILTIAAELPKINPQVYPTTRRSVEYVYNRVNAFEWGYWMYALALLTLILAFGTGRRPLIALGVSTLILAVGLHAFGFITRCIIAERFAIQNQFESMTGLSLFAATVGVVIMLLKRQWLYGAAAAGVGFLVLMTATQTAIPGRFIEREAAILNTSVLLKYHVTTVLCSYGLISLGFIVSLFYLGTYYGAKFRARDTAARAVAYGGAEGGTLAATALNLDSDTPHGTARTLADLDRAQMTVLQLAFWALGVGILLGAWWADHSWGRWWGFDPKETWALATWIIYLIVVHVRLTSGHNRGLITAWLSVLGFCVMIWTYFGVNLLLPGLHAYA